MLFWRCFLLGKNAKTYTIDTVMSRKSGDISEKERQAWLEETAADTRPVPPDAGMPDATKKRKWVRQNIPFAASKADAGGNHATPGAAVPPALWAFTGLSQKDLTDWEEEVRAIDRMVGALAKASTTPVTPSVADGRLPVPEQQGQVVEVSVEVPSLERPRLLPAQTPPILADLHPSQHRPLDKKRIQHLQNPRSRRDATLDLHGLTQDAAYQAVCDFIEHCAASGKRQLRIITGKGAGILQQQLLLWLNNRHLRPKITAITYAGPKEGGTGALLLLLKRV